MSGITERNSCFIDVTSSFWNERFPPARSSRRAEKLSKLFSTPVTFLPRLSHDDDGVVAGRNILVRIDNRFPQIRDAALPPGAGKIGTDGPPFVAHGVAASALPLAPEERLAARAVAGDGGVVVPVHGADKGNNPPDILLADALVVPHLGSGNAAGDGAEQVAVLLAGAKHAARQIGTAPALRAEAVTRCAVNPEYPFAQVRWILLRQTESGEYRQ